MPAALRLKGPTIAVHVVLVILAAVILVPFYWMIVASTRTIPEIVGYPPVLLPGPRFIPNLVELVGRLPVQRGFLNSLYVATVATATQLFFCSLGGYGFAKYRFPGREPLFQLLLATMMIPSALGLIPWYIMMSRFGWVDSYRALIIPGMASAFGIFWMRQVISATVPDELIQAARIDGCSDFGIYWRVVMPIVTPGMGALGIMTFMFVWNDYVSPLIVLRSLDKYTLAVMLALLQNQYNNRLHLVMTGAAISTVPVLVVFFLASRRFISGLTAGAIKA